MPEGPEVRKITDQLDQEVSGKTLTDIIILSGRYENKEPAGSKVFAAALPLEIAEVNCKGKFIYFKVKDSEWSIWSTLGMTGSWTKEPGKHVRIMFAFEDGSKVYYNDMRNFGTLHFVATKAELDKKLKSLGPDMLQEDLSSQEFRAILKKHGTKTLPQVLMNQKIISGVGNYLKAESLYLAKISPHRKCASLTPEEADTLNDIIKRTIRDSYEHGGSTFKTYIDLNGDTGNFSSRFTVYKRGADPLGNEVVSENTKDKRTTWWVPSVQK